MKIHIGQKLWAVRVTHRYGSEIVNVNTFLEENGIDLTAEQYKKLREFEEIVVQTFIGPTKVKRA